MWNIDLPPISKSKGSKEDISPFAIEGVLRDFVEVNEEVEKIEDEHAMTTFVRVCEALAKQGFDFKKIFYSRRIDGKDIYITLEDIGQEYPNIDIIKVIEETGVESNYSLGAKKGGAILAVQGKGTYAITEEEKQKLVALGVIDLGKIEQTQRLTQAKKQRDAAKVQNDKAQELEQQVEQALDQQKKRRKKDEGR